MKCSMTDSEFSKKIINGEVSDNEFLTKYLEDVESLEKLGFPPLTAARMMSGSLYVRTWAKKPSVAVMVKKLPKGYKWTMGEKHISKGGKKAISQSYTLLPIDSDLYIKGIAFAGSHISDPEIIKIVDFRKYTANEIILELMGASCSGYSVDPFEETMIRSFWKANGLKQGSVISCLKDPTERRKNTEKRF